MQALRSLLFAAGQAASTLVFAPLSLLTFPLPFAARYGFITQWCRFNLWWLEVTCGLRYRVTGREHIPAGAAVIACKHQSAWETLALTRIFPPQVWVLKRELLWIPFFGWGLAMLEPIAIDRKSGRKAMRQLLKQGRRRLEQGRWVVVFPEGTRVPPGARAQFGTGAAVLAEHCGLPVVPVAHNAGHYWPRRGFLKRPGTIELVIGPPLYPEGRGAHELNARIREWIDGTVARLEAGAG